MHYCYIGIRTPCVVAAAVQAAHHPVEAVVVVAAADILHDHLPPGNQLEEGGIVGCNRADRDILAVDIPVEVGRLAYQVAGVGAVVVGRAGMEVEHRQVERRGLRRIAL